MCLNTNTVVEIISNYTSTFVNKTRKHKTQPIVSKCPCLAEINWCDLSTDLQCKYATLYMATFMGC